MPGMELATRIWRAMSACAPGLVSPPWIGGVVRRWPEHLSQAVRGLLGGKALELVADLAFLVEQHTMRSTRRTIVAASVSCRR